MSFSEDPESRGAKVVVVVEALAKIGWTAKSVERFIKAQYNKPKVKTKKIKREKAFRFMSRLFSVGLIFSLEHKKGNRGSFDK